VSINRVIWLFMLTDSRNKIRLLGNAIVSMVRASHRNFQYPHGDPTT